MEGKSKTYVVGGLGTSRESLAMICDSIEPWLHSDPIPVRLLDATHRYDDFVADTKGQSVVTYSAASTLFDEIRPRELTAIAPANRFLWRTMPAHALKAAIALKRASIDAKKSTEIHAPFAKESMREIGRHVLDHLSLLRRISQYDTPYSVERMVDDDVMVTLALMEDDPLFFESMTSVSFKTNDNLHIVNIPGGHNDFSLRPAAVYRQIVERMNQNESL